MGLGVPVSSRAVFRRLASRAGTVGAAKPTPLMGFGPSQLCSGRTVPSAFSAAEAHVSFTPTQSPRLIFVGYRPPIQTYPNLSEPDSNRTLSYNRRFSILRGRSRCVGCAFWALTRPCQPSPAAGRFLGGGLCCPGLCFFRVCRALLGCSVAGSSPHAFVGRRPILLRRLSALELGRSRWPVFAEPRWSAANQAGLAPPALQRFESDRRLAPPAAALLDRPGRTSNPYEVFHLLKKLSMHSLA
jgi:hypothetical protein